MMLPRLPTAAAHGELDYLIYPYVVVDGEAMPKDSIKNHFGYANIGG